MAQKRKRGDADTLLFDGQQTLEEKEEPLEIEHIGTDDEDEDEEKEEEPASVIVQFSDVEGKNTGPNIDIPADSTPEQMEALINQLIQKRDGEKVPYSFYLGENEVTETLAKSI
ncbi:unnamed protein product, partial [Heterosigma akashiwo]